MSTPTMLNDNQTVPIVPLPPPLPRWRTQRGLTTFFGVVAINAGIIGLLGVLIAQLLFAKNMQYDWLSPIRLCLSLGAKIGLCIVGILLLKRSRFAWIVLIGTSSLSAIDSLITYAWYSIPMPAGLSEAGQAGRLCGWAFALIAPLIFYAIVLAYLAMPKTEEEFGDKASA